MMDVTKTGLGMRRKLAGFTLIEMLVGLVTSSIVLAGIVGAMMASQKTLEMENDIRGPVGNLRNGLAYIERITKLAGYGIDPRFAFDVATTNLPDNKKDNYVSTTPKPYFSTDDVAFRFRDPAFLRRGYIQSNTLMLDAVGGTKFGAALPDNQPLMVICPQVQMDDADVNNRNGELFYWVGRVNKSTGAAADDTSVPVDAYGAPFPTAVPACASGTGATNAPYVTLMYDVRLRVVELPVNGGATAVPYLVAIYGFGDPATEIAAGNYAPVIQNVRDFQVAYGMNRPAPTSTIVSPDFQSGTGNKNWIMGDASGDAVIGSGNPTAPNYDNDYDHASRFNAHPANIRSLRISVTAYSNVSLDKSANSGLLKRSSWFRAENSTMSDPPADYFITTIGTAVGVANTASRTFFVPFPSSDCGGQLDCNRWGG